MVGPLFEEPQSFDRSGLARRLASLASEGIYIGGSSWKYEGWIGQIYSRSRYVSRGRFSQKIFQAECLREYAETFPTVCGDFAFYQFPSDDFWARLFRNVPEGFRFAFKVPEQITCKTFPTHPRYGAQAGKPNEMFLDAAAFQEMFLRPLLPHRTKTALLIFALMMPAGILAVFAHSPWWALAFISVATASHQGWMANVYTLASDMFAKKDVGSVVGLGGAAGALGGMIIAPIAGYTLQWFHTYVPLFILAGVMHPLAMGVVHWLVPRIEAVQSPRQPAV